jgi:hypothetical protein
MTFCVARYEFIAPLQTTEVARMPMFLLTCLQLVAFLSIGVDPTDPHVLAESPIETDGDGLSIEVDADGHRLRLMFDTGSPGLQLNAEHELCRGNGKMVLSGVADGRAPFQLPIKGPKSLKFGKVDLNSQQTTFASNLNAIRTQITRPANGIIGLDAFQDYVIEFDWDHKLLRLRDNVPKELTDWVEFTRDVQSTHFPVIRGAVPLPTTQKAKGPTDPSLLTEEQRLRDAFEEEDDAYPMKFILASNWPSSQDGFISHADSKALIAKGVFKQSDLEGNPLPSGSEHREFVFLLSGLEVGKQLLSQAFVQALPRNKVNILPVTWMLRYHMALDMPNGRLYLGPRKSPMPPLRNPNLTGLSVVCNAIPRQGDPVKIYVSEVKPDSVAANSGLERLDRVIKFNGLPVGQFRPYEILLAQQLPETEYSLRILRGLNTEFDVVIRVPPLPTKAELEKAK